MKNLTTKEKEARTLKAMDKFYNAALELLIEWQALDYGDKLETILNDGENSDYPFEFSFDDIVSMIGSWQGEVEAQMKKKENKEQ